MAISNVDRVGKALDLLRQGLAPYVERELKAAAQSRRITVETLRRSLDDLNLSTKPISEWDVAALLKVMWEFWNEVFRQQLSFTERSLVSELREWRNKWAHQNPFSSDDAYRVLDSAERLLTAISAPQSDDLNRLKQELLRQRYELQVRNEKRKVGGSLIEAAVSGALKPWREVVMPHPDVASGQYQQAEFAADLWQVKLGQGSVEYQDPVEFFRRTYLTESLKQLLVNAVRRLTDGSGDPVVQLQTNFGGGKTHAMLALYHLCSGLQPALLPGVEALLASAGFNQLPMVRRVVLVGNKLSPGNPSRKPDGTVTRTLWGELAWQLGGPEAYARVALDDERATSPGDTLRELFNDYGPCLILIDEWVAYARQLHDQSDLPGGSFETQFSFAQALTEAARLARNCLLVVSLPASDTASGRDQAEDVEVGGLRGREALERLRNVIGRVESSWRPATAEEGFEIVRRRLFQPITDPAAYTQRDITARAFAELYIANKNVFPIECSQADYEQRIKAAYPIHPEVFDRLYEDWSAQVRFQRTRGVLRLMAAVIHSLWQANDHSPLIMPATIPIDDSRVQFELTRYLSENWTPIISKDVDGPQSLPVKIDADTLNLGRHSATRRVARTIFLGSAPLVGLTQRGLDERRVMLGCIFPGEPLSVFGDALRRLATSATYLYQDGTRYWYDIQPTVTKLAEDRAEQLKRDADQVNSEIERRLREALRKTSDFASVHVLPRTSADVPDQLEARLVVLSPEMSYYKGGNSRAEQAAQQILDTRGSTPRIYRNTLVFLVADKMRLSDLEDATRQYLAWSSILNEKDTLNLTPFQVRQAEEQRRRTNEMVQSRLPEVYQWVLVPEQETPQASISWKALQLRGEGALAERPVMRLRNADHLLVKLGATVLRGYLDNIPLWRGNHVAVRQLVEDFAKYLYLPRLCNPDVLIQAIRDGLSLLTWRSETFAYAEGYDEASGQYRGLRAGEAVTLTTDDQGLLVKPDVAVAQLAATTVREPTPAPPTALGTTLAPTTDPMAPGSPAVPGVPAPSDTLPSPPPLMRRFHGSVTLDPQRMVRDAGKIAEEIIYHLVSQDGADVTVTLEITARFPKGADERLVRIVTENARALHFDQQAFESE
ncbi:MAG: DUF499 domain-containing protein [Chloroflexus sp.]